MLAEFASQSFAAPTRLSNTTLERAMEATRHIVYVTSDHSLSQMRRLVMESVGYTVAAADTAEKALNALHQRPAFLVVVGVLTPPGVADQVIQTLHDEMSGLPILSLASRPHN